MPIYSRTGRSGSAGLVARSCRFANPPSRARSRAPTGPRLPLGPRMLTYPQWANCFDQQPGPPVITSTLEASASATADLWLSASTRPVRCSIQGIALSGSIQGQGSLPGRADQLRRDLQKLYGQRHEIVDGQPAMALIHCLRKRIRDAGPHPDHGGLLNAELHRDGVGGPRQCVHAEVAPVISVTVEPGSIVVHDNGGGIKTATIKSILDYNVRVFEIEATKRGITITELCSTLLCGRERWAYQRGAGRLIGSENTGRAFVSFLSSDDDPRAAVAAARFVRLVADLVGCE